MKVDCLKVCLVPSPGPTVEQQTEMARNTGRTLASLHPDQVAYSYIFSCFQRYQFIIKMI